MISNPSELDKYGTLNFIKVAKRLTNCTPALELFFIVGFDFRYIDNQQKLIWNNTENNMRIIKDMIVIFNMNNGLMNRFISLLNGGYDYKDAMTAINVSHID